MMQRFERLKEEWAEFFRAPDPVYQEMRVRTTEVYVALPVKAMVILMLFYYFFISNWIDTVTAGEIIPEIPPREFALEVVRYFFLIYVVLNTAGASLLLGMRQLPREWMQQVVFSVSLVDGLFLAALTAVTEGYYSVLYWAYLGLIARNALSTTSTTRQITLNCVVTGCYLLAGWWETRLSEWELEMLDERTVLAIQNGMSEGGTEPFLLRLFLLLLMTVCCYGVQVLFDKQRQAEEEAREFAARQEQLQAAGRLAAEIAHQLKNPLGIINNASFTLLRTITDGKPLRQQVEIIREEVERSDRILTELMGYAQLTEGKVEKLDVAEELDRAIQQVFPSGASYGVEIERQYARPLPPLLVQRGHLQEVFVNLLQNARELLGEEGRIGVSARGGENYSVVVQISDNGPGIEPEKLEKIFEPYFSTKPKGTGLGLAIVKHNIELYGGTVKVESDVGKGTTFTISLPAKSLLRIRR